MPRMAMAVSNRLAVTNWRRIGHPQSAGTEIRGGGHRVVQLWGSLGKSSHNSTGNLLLIGLIFPRELSFYMVNPPHLSYCKLVISPRMTGPVSSHDFHLWSLTKQPLSSSQNCESRDNVIH